MRVAHRHETAEPRGIVRPDRGADRWPGGEHAAPSREAGEFRRHGGEAQGLEDVEITEYRTEGGVDQGKAVAGEPGPERRLGPPEATVEILPRGPAGLGVWGIVEPGDRVQQCRGDLDPAPVLGPRQGIGGMQRVRPVSSRYSRIAALSKTARPPTESIGVLPSGESARNQSGLAARSTSIRRNGTAFSVSAMAARCT